MKAKSKVKKLKPIEARTFQQVCKLSSDHYDTKHYWLIIDGDIILCEQQTGEPPTNKMRLRRAEFDKLARWYVTGKATK